MLGNKILKHLGHLYNWHMTFPIFTGILVVWFFCRKINFKDSRKNEEKIAGGDLLFILICFIK